ncbi:aldolase/citrate lyase family protein [Nocardioides panacihumi]|uniref:Aldolase/citrate lyase family protein n=1 Tax=Nocardioides panacihumi TaxID=400774 RepID=A0ABP5C260_9ACTN
MTRRADVDGVAERLTAQLDARLAAADAALAAGYPGARPGRQPVHTVYVPADRYEEDLVGRYGAAARQSIEEHAEAFAAVVGDADIVDRVRAKLASEPVEDLRIDFEDGYVGKGDADEDADVLRAATALAASRLSGRAAPFGGIRIKCLEPATRRRAIRTLTAFVATLVDHGAGLDGWVVTLPKVTSVDQVEAMLHACGVLEGELGLAEGTLRFEIQVETPQSILGPDGTALVARMVHAAGHRLTGLHYGTYDYSAFCGIAAEQQSLEHPVADHAKLVMQAAAAGTGVRLSDGSTNVLPVGDAADIEAAWSNHHRLVRRSLERGFYQGWDLHPAQLPTRYAATYAFYREGLPRALTRLADYTRHTTGGIADEPATARALAAYLLRGVDCGAVDETEIVSATSLGAESLQALAHYNRPTTA